MWQLGTLVGAPVGIALIGDRCYRNTLEPEVSSDSLNLPFPLIFSSSWHIDTSPSDWSAGLGGKEDSWQISGQYKSQNALMK